MLLEVERLCCHYKFLFYFFKLTAYKLTVHVHSLKAI